MLVVVILQDVAGLKILGVVEKVQPQIGVQEVEGVGVILQHLLQKIVGNMILIQLPVLMQQDVHGLLWIQELHSVKTLIGSTGRRIRNGQGILTAGRLNGVPE